MKLLTDEQLREIEQREKQKRIQKELEEQRIRDIESQRRADERKAMECYRLQLRNAHEPVIGLIDSLTENNYLILQYQNPNGNIKTYKFKSKNETRIGEHWIAYDVEFNIYVSNGHDRTPVIYQNILGCEVREERVANVIMIGGVKYTRSILESDKVDINMVDKSAMTYKGDFT